MTKEKKICERDDCGNDATDIVYDRSLGKVVRLCDYHDEVFQDRSNSEYFEHCPNCGCGIPIN